jgi:hypothetical protein
VPFSTFVNPARIAQIALTVALTGTLVVPTAVQHLQTASGIENSPLLVSGSPDTISGAAALKERSIDRVIADADAVTTIGQAKAAAASVQTTIDTVPISDEISTLSNYKHLDTIQIEQLTEKTKTATGVLQEIAAEAARAAAEAKAQAAAAAAAALAQANTPDGARATAQTMMASSYGWGGDQFQCLNSLWTKESNWRYQAANGGSGATGIPQALPGSKMASAGSDWATDAATQIRWGLGYIARSYGTPCAAWSHSEAMNWY